MGLIKKIGAATIHANINKHINKKKSLKRRQTSKQTKNTQPYVTIEDFLCLKILEQLSLQASIHEF